MDRAGVSAPAYITGSGIIHPELRARHMSGIFSKPVPHQPLAITLLERCETSLQTHIILKQLEIQRKAAQCQTPPS